MPRSLIIGYACSLFAVLLWSLNGIIANAFAARMTPIELTFGRWFIASLIFLPFVGKHILNHIEAIKKHSLLIVSMAVTGIILTNIIMYHAGHTTSALNISLINRLTPIFLVILTALFLKVKVGVRQIFGIALAVWGVLYIILKGDILSIASLSFAKGDLFMLVSAFSFAVYSLLQMKRPADIPQSVMLGLTAMVGAIALSPFFIYQEIQTHHILTLDKTDWLVLLYLGFGLSVLGYLAWNIALQKLGTIKASVVSYLTPVLTSIEAYYWLGNKISTAQIVGGLFVLAGIFIVERSKITKDK